MEKLFTNWTMNGWFILSCILIILSIFLFNMFRKIREKMNFLYQEKKRLQIKILHNNPFLNKDIYSLSNLKFDIFKIRQILAKNETDEEFTLILHASVVFEKKVNKMKFFDDINTFLMEMYNRNEIKKKLMDCGFFNNTNKKVRQVVLLHFESLKESGDHEKLKDFLRILEHYFSEYKDLYSTYFAPVNELLTKENVPA